MFQRIFPFIKITIEISILIVWHIRSRLSKMIIRKIHKTVPIIFGYIMYTFPNMVANGTLINRIINLWKFSFFESFLAE